METVSPGRRRLRKEKKKVEETKNERDSKGEKGGKGARVDIYVQKHKKETRTAANTGTSTSTGTAADRFLEPLYISCPSFFLLFNILT